MPHGRIYRKLTTRYVEGALSSTIFRVFSLGLSLDKNRHCLCLEYDYLILLKVKYQGPRSYFESGGGGGGGGGGGLKTPFSQ